MAVKIYNVTDDLLITFQNYLDALEAAEGEELEDTYRIVFMYKKSDLFNAVKKRTALRGKNVKDQDGNVQLDRIAMTGDEETIFDDAVFHGAANVFKVLSGYARDTEYAFKFDEVIEDEKYIIFYLDLDIYTDTNYIKLLDPVIEDAIVRYVIREWYEYIGFEDVQIANYKYQEALNEVKSRSNYLKKNLTRPTPLF